MDLDVKGEGPTSPHDLHAGDFQAAVFAYSTECKYEKSDFPHVQDFDPCWKAKSVGWHSLHSFNQFQYMSIICFVLSSFATSRFQHICATDNQLQMAK